MLDRTARVNTPPKFLPNAAFHAAPDFFRRHAFHIGIGVFVVVMSFAYGLSAGLAKRNGKAFALPERGVFAPSDFDAGDSRPARLKVPDGVIVIPLGRDITINDQAAEMISFVTERPAKELVEEQMDKWRTSGLTVVGKATNRRGFAIAFQQNGGERYSFSAWSVPPVFRSQMSQGKPVQGMMSVVDGRASGVRTDGTVPEVPLKPGGKGGAVFSSLDGNGRTFSGVYTLPGSVLENIHYYRAELADSGWQELVSDYSQPQGAKFNVGNMIFRKDGEELVLLFSPVAPEKASGALGAENSDGAEDTAASPASFEEQEKSIVAITKGPLAIENWRPPV